jgi:hypothetical protein
VTKEPAGSPGLSWSMFRGEWPWMPDFRTLTPATKGEVKRVDLSMASGKQPFGMAFQGFFHAELDGEYTFTLDSDTGAMLFLHDIRVIDEALKNPAGKFSGSVRLQAGWHPLRLYYRHVGDSRPKLNFEARSPSGAPLKLDGSNLRSIARQN